MVMGMNMVMVMEMEMGKQFATHNGSFLAMFPGHSFRVPHDTCRRAHASG